MTAAACLASADALHVGMVSKRRHCASKRTFATVDSTVCQAGAKIGAFALLQKHHAVQALDIADIDHKRPLWLSLAENREGRCSTGIEYADTSLRDMRVVLPVRRFAFRMACYACQVTAVESVI